MHTHILSIVILKHLFLILITPVVLYFSQKEATLVLLLDDKARSANGIYVKANSKYFGVGERTAGYNRTITTYYETSFIV